MIASFGYGAAEAYGVIRTMLERQGTPIGSLDMLIAAHARLLDLSFGAKIETERGLVLF